MRIILTHEQADFDAMGSLLAASLLDETSLPVLPNRMNRNVRAFLTIYGAELPFIEQRDLPTQAVKSVLLVDTQSMITVRGISSKTQVHIIDHHPRREDIPANWTVSLEETGATTTQLCEQLQVHNGALSVVHATLLLLGIYEDTGSLTYSRTTARDLHAAAYLMEQGASLRIAADFLNHPLSQGQQALYDELRQRAELLRVHGHSIIVAQGDASQMQEELSTIAHKLRDLLDPDGLFVVVGTRGGVQLIARSTSDQVDVSAVAAHFGGGGHERAAAALIRDRSADEVVKELKDSLPRIVQPAVTVAQIMSGRPQLLATETSVSEALERMQRYGYEGYPVVRQGRVVGLLTRRAVDRAIAHKLNLTAASLMNAGEVTIYPDDSIEHLQRLMTDSGWGQVPVVDPNSGAIIGIVTRTDLLKILTPLARLSRRMNLADKLSQALPPARLALLKTLAVVGREQHTAVYVVGGFVRDLLLERPSLDFDIVVEGDAIALARALCDRLGGRITTHARFGTAKWYLGPAYALVDGLLQPKDGSPGTEPDHELPDFIDLISARTEFYTEPTALPTVERGSIKLDLHRRDFTINTLALRLDGSHFGDLQDYWGGLGDLHQGLVRVLHSISFIDDPTRMLRAVRYEQRYGFQIEPRTLSLLEEALPLASRVTGERLNAELEHILDEPQAVAMLERLEDLHLLHAIHPDLSWDAAAEARLKALPANPPETDWGLPESSPGHGGWGWLRRTLAFALWMMTLSQETVGRILKRLSYPHQEGRTILSAARLQKQLGALPGMGIFEVVTLLDEYPLVAVYAAYLEPGSAEARQTLEDYLLCWRKVKPFTNGFDLRRMGLPPSPVYRRILEALRRAWLEGRLETVEGEQALLADLLRLENISLPGERTHDSR